MKKVMAILIMMAMVLSLSVVAFANNGGFIQSPTGGTSLISYKFHTEQQGVLSVGLTKYADRADLLKEDRDLLEQAYADIAGADNLTTLIAGLKKIAGNLKSNVAASDLFDISIFIDGNQVHNTPVDVVLGIENAEKFAALVHMDEQGNWTVVEGAKVNADGNLEATLNEYSPFAIVIADGTPNPGDGIDVAVYASIMAVAAIAVVLVIRKSSKKAA